MREIKLTKGMITLVDDEDFEYLNQWNWYAIQGNSDLYVSTYINKKTVLMHRLIMKAPKNLVIDHRDRNTFNNQKDNLRICTHNQNLCNRIYKRSKINYRGVYINGNGFMSTITINRKLVYLGSFRTAKEAAKAYDNAAKIYHGEFARLNFSDK